MNLNAKLWRAMIYEYCRNNKRFRKKKFAKKDTLLFRLKLYKWENMKPMTI